VPVHSQVAPVHSQVARLKTPGALSRTEPSPYSRHARGTQTHHYRPYPAFFAIH
jgi:hypothetical protein